jgi:predicted Rossmann fold flavoprotein
VVIGGGAAGLMAGACAAEMGLHCVVIERRHRPGLKLLLCGNNRCNVTHRASVEEMLDAYGEPVASFLRPAMAAFPPDELRRWFADRGLRTTVHEDGRVFPASEQADDVVHCFRDVFRDREIPLVHNCPVLGIERSGDSYRVRTMHFSLVAPRVLVATGGVSYPKTGSVGDGQRFARELGHRVLPFRPGLAGIELDACRLVQGQPVSLPDTEVGLFCGGTEVARTKGEILLDRVCARGPAMVNASRIMARENLRDVEFRVDLFPGLETAALARRVVESAHGRRGRKDSSPLSPGEVFAFLASLLPPANSPEAKAKLLKDWRIPVRGVRPLKEAMVTVGGVDLADIDPTTMQSRRSPGLFFAGEVMDVDGPTGGYNLHAAFATARLAVSTIASEASGRSSTPPPAPFRKRR